METVTLDVNDKLIRAIFMISEDDDVDTKLDDIIDEFGVDTVDKKKSKKKKADKKSEKKVSSKMRKLTLTRIK